MTLSNVSGCWAKVAGLLLSLCLCVEGAVGGPQAVTKEELADAFIEDFLRQPPREQAELWKKRRTRYPIGIRMRELLIARGTESAPYLAEIVRSGRGQVRIDALELLCDMDRFVPAQQLIFPEWGNQNSMFREKVEKRGSFDHFRVVDGRRIGATAYAAVEWATQQEKDSDLRFHARLCTGLLDEEIRALALDEVIRRWRQAVVRTSGALERDFDATTLSSRLEHVLIERAPESLPLVMDVLENDRNGFVREEAMGTITGIDVARVRLRKSDSGLRAVEAVRQALARGGLKPVFYKEEERERHWKWIQGRIFADNYSESPEWRFYAYALSRLYGAKTAAPRTDDQEEAANYPLPSEKWRKFYTHLSEIDPFFPSWEFFDHGRDETLHPRFRHLMERLYKEWLRYSEGTQSPKD